MEKTRKPNGRIRDVIVLVIVLVGAALIVVNTAIILADELDSQEEDKIEAPVIVTVTPRPTLTDEEIEALSQPVGEDAD